MEPLYKGALSPIYNGKKYDNIRSISTDNNENGTKKILNIYHCDNNECNKLYFCPLPRSYYACPYITNCEIIKEPRKNSFLYEQFHLLYEKLLLIHMFGNYSQWVFNNKNEKIDADLFCKLKNIKEFSLANLTRNRVSYNKEIEKIEKNPSEYGTWEICYPGWFNISNNLSNSIIKFYIDALTEYREGLLGLNLLADDHKEFEYYQWRSRQKTLIIYDVGDYYLLPFSYINSTNPNEIFECNVHCEKSCYKFYLKKVNLDKAIEFLKNNNRFYIRFLKEHLIKIKNGTYRFPEKEVIYVTKDD